MTNDLKVRVPRNRRSGGGSLRPINVKMGDKQLEMLKERGIESGRSVGTISAFLEIAAVLTINIFENPAEAVEQVKTLVKMDSHYQDRLALLAANFEQMAKLLEDDS